MTKILFTLFACLIIFILPAQTSQSQPLAYKTDSSKKKSNHKDAEFSIFPNASSNFIKIRSTGAPPDAISVHDIAGTKLMEDKSGRVLSIYSLPQGIYFVYVRLGNKTEKIRFEKL
ncbi:MAG: T9SS type A sorting domain-containing protein [Bacteroidetes bacterium]|nr:T9SS type A sorting domain-containing protein [Bacteroidota bacterium]